ncbi:MAG: inosine monophosphate cyclohydrolase [Desulfobacteraceae bacterium]|nr:MAG: inosine monophosphate cyclohydrolase [Desulfobacteraceae bacterium]
MTPNEKAEMNFEQHLRQNPYPGRGLVMGRASNNDWLILYWIMGRSTQSRNRRFAAENGTLRTEPVDAKLVADPSLIIYEAMLELPGFYLVSNGDQTRTLHQVLAGGGTFDQALATREREPDGPNFTPRISGMLNLKEQPTVMTLSVLKANSIDPQFTDRFTYRPSLPLSGFGFGVTTYSGDGSPLPSFAGEPLLLPLAGDAKTILDKYWNALDVENRVSLALKRIPDKGGPSEIMVRNRF